MVTDRIWQEHLLPKSPNRDRVQETATWLHTLLLLAMTTCFMSNQICRVGGSLWFSLIHNTHYFFTTCHFSSILRHFVVMEQRMFGIGAHSLFS